MPLSEDARAIGTFINEIFPRIGDFKLRYFGGERDREEVQAAKSERYRQLVPADKLACREAVADLRDWAEGLSTWMEEIEANP